MSLFFIGQSVSTPYGSGKVSEVRENDVVVIPNGWLMACGQKPTFYLNNKEVKPFFNIDDSIECSFGKGIVKSIRTFDGIYVVVLDTWKLANGASPTLYLNESSLSKSIKIVELVNEKKTNYTAECLAKSQAAKDDAAAFFKKSELYNARSKYLESVESLQYLGDNLTNDEKAKVFEQSVLCNNNIALCCLRLKDFPESVQFGKNALMLIETLESRIPNAQVWHCLLAAGMTMEKFQKEWKKKSLFLLGKAELGLNNYQAALDHLKAALSLIATDESPVMIKQSDELRLLIAQAQTKRNAEKKKERATWSKAFEKGKTSTESLYSDPIVGSDSTSSAAPSPMSASKQSVGVVEEEEELFIPLAKYGLKDVGSKKTATSGKAKSSFKTSSAAEGTMIKPADYWGLAILATIGVAVGLGGWFFRQRRW